MFENPDVLGLLILSVRAGLKVAADQGITQVGLSNKGKHVYKVSLNWAAVTVY